MIKVGIFPNAGSSPKLDVVQLCGLGGSVWVMGEWSVSQWILGVMRFQKIFGLYGVERHKVEKWSG